MHSSQQRIFSNNLFTRPPRPNASLPHSMRAYSPPVTRQRARALFIAQVAEQQQQQGQQAQGQSGRQRRRDQVLAGAGESEGSSNVRGSKEARSAKVGTGTDLKPGSGRSRGRRGARFGSGRAGALSSRTADVRPVRR